MTQAPSIKEAFIQYRRKQIAELRLWQPGDDMSGISVSAEDTKAGSPKAGDMIARNPKNHADQWLVAKAYFADNFEPLATLQPAGEIPAPVYKAVERILDEKSAWVARPSDDVTKSIALQAVVAAHKILEKQYQLSPPDGERREAIARIKSILVENIGAISDDERCHVEIDGIDETVAAILASGLVQDEAGIRADEREKCAKALDDIETDSDGKCHWTDVALATAAIRSARDGGAET